MQLNHHKKSEKLHHGFWLQASENTIPLHRALPLNQVIY